MATSDERGFSLLLITQNVGYLDCPDPHAVPEAVQQSTTDWIATVASFVELEETNGRPVDVLVIHFQEVGGKKFSGAFNEFLDKKIKNCYPGAAWCSGLLMPRHDDEYSFTAMATVVFVSSIVFPRTSLLSFRHRTFLHLTDVGPTTQPNWLFHGAKFVNAEKSRKGFLLSSIRIGTRVVNLLNLHLYHDADNMVAVEASPSSYVPRRTEAFVEAISEIVPVINPEDALFVFGDLNMRLDAKRFVEHCKAQYGWSVSMGKKEVKAPEAFWTYVDNPSSWNEIMQFDIEGLATMETVAAQCNTEFAEIPRTFGPTYAIHAEGPKVGKYRSERLPAWCDRVWLNPPAAALLQSGSSVYWVAPLVPMDHRAVYFRGFVQHKL